MKPHPALTPLAGFNIRGVPVRLHVDTATPRRCTNHGVDTKRPLATRVVGARRYCPDCAAGLIAFAREGDRAGLEVRL